MSPNPSIVPSRNALRALRRLAYGGSTIIGAVGSVFTVAGVSYDTQRRVRLAERLIDTKRTIRSVSNSNGAAHVAQMFEAAEKGEDFGLNNTRSRKRHIRRDYSALTTESTHQHNPAEIATVGSHHSSAEDEAGDRKLAEEDSPSRKKSIRQLQGSTRIRSRSLSSPRWAKGLPPESPLLGQRQLVQERSGKTATYDHARAVTDQPQTGPLGAGRILIESYPAMRDMLDTTVRKTVGPTSNLPHAPDQNRDSGRNLGEDHSAVDEILASTKQQQKLHDHGVYGRPGKDRVSQRVKADASSSQNHRPNSNSSAAEKIVAATQQQHKLHSHTVYGRPSKANAKVQTPLNEHVALWLNGDGVSRSNSGLKCESGSQTEFTLNGGNNSKRPGSTFPGDTPYLKPLRRNLSTSASEINAVSPSPPVGISSLQQEDGHAAVRPTQVPRSVPHTSDQDGADASKERPPPFQPAHDHIKPYPSGTNQSVPSDERHASAGSEPRPRRDRVIHGPRRYLHYSSSSSKELAPAVETDTALQPDEQDVPSRKQSAVPIALDLKVKPWPASVPANADIPENTFTEKFLPKNLQSDVNQIQHTEASVINDLSDQSSLHHVRKSSVQEDLSQRRSEALSNSDRAFEECVTVSKAEGYAVWDRFIRAAIEEQGPPAARQVWLKAMAYYAAPGDKLDWNRVDDLHKHFHKAFWRALPPYLEFDSVRLLTRRFLGTAPTSQRAAELLFPLHGKETELEAEYAARGMAYPATQRSRNLFANASKYLTDLWDEEYDTEKVVSELRKVIQIANMQDIELAEDLFFGTIRRLCSNGQIEQAQALFDEMAYYHQIEPSFSTRSVLVCGHARAGDWDRVAKEIEAMHNVHDLSRREPLGYSSMFNDVLVEYASRRSIAQTHDFLVHALGYWGLVPTSAISATAIQAFLVHQRFDLVREWIETVRILFPQVDTETTRFAWHLGSVWEDINASCVEVEEACKALCYRKDASKVQAALREMVRLALARDLATKLHAAEVAEAGSKRQDVFPAGSPWALNHYLERAQSFAPDTSINGQIQSTESKEARELLSQVEAVARLDKLFGTKGRFTDPPSVNFHESSQPRSLLDRTGPAHAASLQSHVPTDLMRDLLPSLPEVERLLNQYYSARQNKGLPISHAILQYTCQKLKKQDRRVDAMKLLKAMFHSSYVQTPIGVMYNLSLMEMWLRFAYETKSLSHCLTVFWAVLDAGEDYLLTSKFVLLAKMSYHKVRRNRFDALARTNPLKHEELEYLLESLTRRLWLNKERFGPKSDNSKGAEYHKMKNQMRRRLIVGKQRTVEVPS
jgi:hypothetical protein